MPCAPAAFALILGYLCVLPAVANQDACHERSIPASVFGKNGAPVPTLSMSNFEATFQGKPVRVRSAAPEQEPPRIVILLDTSGSMKETEKGALDIAESLLSRMPPNAEVGLAFFAKDLVPVALPTSDRESLKHQLKGLRTHPSSFRGKTALWDAIGNIVGMFSHPQFGDAVFLITDADDNQSKTKPEKVIQLLAVAGIRLFVVQLADREAKNLGMTPEDISPFRGEISRVAEETGGYVIKSTSPNQVSLDTEYWRIASFYRIEIDLPETVDKPRRWKLDLAGFAKPQRAKLVLTYPQMLVPCR
jgi:von Willebrand factor type A domain